MGRKAAITVQIVHIDGPHKGNIDKFDQFPITIGRHPDCQICFPQDQTLISRHHAELVREGNRCKVVDHSTNGTFVNGKKVKETFLKDGDVLLIGHSGPKISFLSEIKDTLPGPDGAATMGQTGMAPFGQRLKDEHR